MRQSHLLPVPSAIARRAGIAAAVLLSALLLLLGPASGARGAGLSWSAGRSVDRSLGKTLTTLACADENHCVALDSHGRAVAFNGATGTSTQPPVLVSPEPGVLACPAATQCTVVTPDGSAYTFDPATPSEPTTTL